MKELLEFLVKNIVDKKDQVVIEEEVKDTGKILRLSVATEDMGRIIGKKGRLIKAIRDLIRIKAIKEDQRVYLELTEQNQTNTEH
jgi:uncharacterized protein